jgi:hypothetical protein
MLSRPLPELAAPAPSARVRLRPVLDWNKPYVFSQPAAGVLIGTVPRPARNPAGQEGHGGVKWSRVAESGVDGA